MTNTVTEVGGAGEEMRNRGLRSIALHTLAATFSFFLIEVLTAVVLLSAGLRFGRKGLLIVTAISGGLLLIVGSAIAAGQEPATGIALAYAARMVLVIGIPVIVAMKMLDREQTIGPVLVMMLVTAAAGYGVLEIASRALFEFSPLAWAISQIEPSIGPAIELQRSMGAPQERLDILRTALETGVRSFLPALYGALAALTFAMGLIALPRMGLTGPVSAGFLLRNLRLPDHLLFAVIVGCLSPVYPEPFRVYGLNLLAVVALLYLFQGIAVFRALVLRLNLGTAGKVLVWSGFGLMMLNGFVPIVLAIVGLFDSFFDFRTPKNREIDDESNTD